MVKENRKVKNKKSIALILTIVLLFLSTISVFAISTVEDNILAYKQEKAIQLYENKTTKRDSSVLNVTKSELGKPIAELKIPSLKLNLPIYQGTTDDILDNGIGLIDGTGDIKGGVGRNPVLSGHNGLSSKNLFTSLPSIKNKAKFFIKINNEYHEYEVKSQKVVVGTDLEANPPLYLAPKAGKETVTLMTCVPRYINNKRLLVTGYRIPLNKKDLAKEKNSDCNCIGSTNKKQNNLKPCLFGASLAIIVLIIGIAIHVIRKRKRNKGGNDVE